MKKTFAISLLALLALTFTACQRCTVCTTTVRDPQTDTTSVYAEEEYCGRDLTNWEDEQIEYAGWKNKTGGYDYYQCSCVRE